MLSYYLFFVRTKKKSCKSGVKYVKGVKNDKKVQRVVKFQTNLLTYFQKVKTVWKSDLSWSRKYQNGKFSQSDILGYLFIIFFFYVQKKNRVKVV